MTKDIHLKSWFPLWWTFAIYKKIRNKNIPIDLQLKLFVSLVESIILYGSEVWGFENIQIMEKIHLKFCKRIFFFFYFIMILLSIYIYNWIGNKFSQLTSPSPYKYINSINKTNQMTANVQAISIIISKLSKRLYCSEHSVFIFIALL
jgi:uncharacterized membrane protein